MFLKIVVVLGLITASAARPQLLSFKDGNVGVNFAGYHASAGLGGLLSGNGNGGLGGGLFAEAGTPQGQQAGAGLGGILSGEGTAGGLYAGATAGKGIVARATLGGKVDNDGVAGVLEAESHVGDGIGARAGLAGSVDSDGVVGGLAASSHAGGAGAGAGLAGGVQGGGSFGASETSANAGGQQVIHSQIVKSIDLTPRDNVRYSFETAPGQTYNTKITKTISFSPPVQKTVHVQSSAPAKPVQATEKRIETNIDTRVNVEDIQVGHKTDLDSAVVKQTAAPPLRIKTVVTNSQSPGFQKFFDFRLFSNLGNQFGASTASHQTEAPVQQVVVQKTHTPVQPSSFNFIKQFRFPSRTSVSYNHNIQAEGGKRSSLINDIFNIPISTLGAVNRLVNNAVNANHGFHVNKQVTFY